MRGVVQTYYGRVWPARARGQMQSTNCVCREAVLSAGTSLCLLTLRGCFCSHKGSSGGCRETRWPTTLTTCLFPEVCRPLTWSCSQSHLLDPSSGSYGKGCVWNPSTTVDCLRFLGSTGFSLCVFRPELVGAYGFRWWYLPGEVLPFYLYKMLFFTHAVL